MAQEKTHADSLTFRLTGAGSHEGVQTDPNASLGNFIAEEVSANPVAAGGLTTTYSGGEELIIREIAATNGVGTGVITAVDDDTVTWTPPGGSPGPAVFFAATETNLVEGSDPNKWVRVRREVGLAMSTTNIPIVEKALTVFGLDDVSSAEQAAGDTEYRCVGVKNHAPATASAVTVRLLTLGTQQVTDTTQLGASGAGSIVTTGSFADWPNSGFAKIVDSGGSEREIVYYASRTATTLTIPAVGRGLRGSSAAAGAADDTADAIPVIDLGLDAPSSQPSGSFVDNTGVGEGTAPAGVTFSAPITIADALAVGDLSAGEIYGIWLRRTVPAGATAQTSVLQHLSLNFDAG